MNEENSTLSVRKGINEEQARQIATWYEEYCQMLHDMYNSPQWVEVYGKHKELRVLSLCLFFQSITVEQLLSTCITPAAEPTSERTFLNRLTTKKYLSRLTVDTAPSETTIMYVLTSTGATWCVKQLKELMIEARKLALPYVVSDNCIDAVMERFKRMPDRQNLGHYLAIRSVNSYLLSPACQPNYTCQLEAVIEPSGRIVPLYERLLFGVGKNTGSFQCDALFTCPFRENNSYYLYIEQDMGTQRGNVLLSKIINYISSIFSYDSSSIHTLMFSIQTHTAHLSRRKIDKLRQNKDCASSAATHYVRTAILYAKSYKYIGNGEIDDNDIADFPLHKVTDFLDKIDGIRSTESPTNDYNKFFKNASLYMKSLLEIIPNATIEDLIDNTRENIETGKKALTDFNEERHQSAYFSRRSLLFTVAMGNQNVREAFLKGFSIFTSPTRDLGYVMPYLVPGLFGELETHIRFLLPFCGYIPDSKVPYIYEPVTSTYKKDGYVLKNHYIFDNSFHLYVENVSDDIGGFYRLSHYLTSLSWSESPGVLLCLLSDDAIDSIKKLWSDSVYAQNLYSSMHISLPLEVIFITYTSLEQNRGAFVFDENLTIHRLEMGEKSPTSSNP